MEEKTIEKVLELTSQGWKRSEIAAELGLSYSTVKRYQSPDFNPVHGKYNTTRNSKIKTHEEKIKPTGRVAYPAKRTEYRPASAASSFIRLPAKLLTVISNKNLCRPAKRIHSAGLGQ